MDIKSLALDILVALLIPALTALTTQLIMFIGQQLKKRGLDLSAEQQAKLEALAQKAILAVEEWARGQFKTSGIVTTGDVKMGLAKNIVSEQLPNVSPELVEAAINTQLATLRVASPESLNTLRADPR